MWWNTPGGKNTFRGCDSLEEWSNETKQETSNGNFTGLQIDPLLNGPYYTSITDPYKLEQLVGFRLKKDSPVKNIGVDPKSFNAFNIPVVDFFGNSIPRGKTLIFRCPSY